MILNRKDFIKLTSLTSIAAFLNSCGINTDEEKDLLNLLSDSINATSNTQILKSVTNNDVIYITSADEKYEALRNGFCKRINKFPAIIAICLNTNGVKEAVLYATENKLPLSVKSGGHCFEGFSVNDNGMMIHLSQLNYFDLSNDGILKIGPGYKLGEVYENLLKHQKIIPAGSCSGVGISGLTLGGGYGLFSREFGLTCDSLLEAEMVTADGKIITTKNNPELLWALKGAGNGNFGIVTQLTFTTQQAPKFIQSSRFKCFDLNPEKAKLILQTWFDVATELPNDCFSAFVLNGKKLTILITNTHKQTPKLKNLFNTLSKVTDKTALGKETPIKYAINVFKGGQQPIYFKNASVGFYKSFDDIAPIIDDVIEYIINNKGFIYQINTLGGNISNSDFEKASCFPYRSYPFLSELQSYWDDDKKTDGFIKKFNAIQTLFFEAKINNQYVNYPAIENPDYETAYYGSNLTKLKEIKKTYDPFNVFKHAQSISL